MTLERINPAELARPSGFSHAVRATGRSTIWLAGQTALDQHGVIVGGDIVEQFERALANLLVALRAAGGQPSDLTSLTIYIVDLDDYRRRAKDIGVVWRRLAGTEHPATAAVGVTRLWDEAAMVELQATAAVEG